MPESYKEDGRPAQQWYWDDWFSSHDVQSCSFAAQGLWINLLGIMFTSEIRGTLTINGIQMDNKAIAKRFGESITNINKWINELEEARVFSRLPDGTIISRRMYRESGKKEKISQIRSEAGKKGMEKRWQKNNKKITKITAPTPSSTPSPTSSSKHIDVIEEDFEKNLWKPWPEEGRFKNKYCLMKYRALCKAGKQKEFMKTTRGYATYLQMKEERDNFKQQVMHLSTWMNNWEGEKERYMNFKYEAPL